MNTIQVTIRNVYGNRLIYPACDTAKTFASMVGRKTLTFTDIEHIKKLGYKVEVVLEKEEL